MKQIEAGQNKAVRCSRRTQWDKAETPWAQELARMRASGAKLFDLTQSNPTRCGFHYDTAALLAPLNDPRAIEYEPDPKGVLRARQAVCSYYRDHGVHLDPGSIVLTTSTSEAYSFLFRLLCDPGDEVLVAQPSYPLFDLLAGLDTVSLVPYELFYDHGWHLDPEALRRRLTSRTKAILLVHPNNPTGHFTRPGDRLALERICREYGLALIVDEVFLDYSFAGTGAETGAVRSFGTGEHSVPVFILSGLSKVAALPQMKAAWIAAFGPGPELTEAIDRLEIIADTFLSMNAPIQYALPAWLDQRQALQRQIVQRVSHNLNLLDNLLLRASMVSRLQCEGGWYAVLRIPSVEPEEKTVYDLLTKRAVAVHPGYFFGFSGSGRLIVSLLPAAEEFSEGVSSLLKHFADRGGNQASY